MKFIKEALRYPLFTFILGGGIGVISMLILFEQRAIKKSEDALYLAKSNLAMAESFELNQKLMVIQDSILRLDKKIFKTDSVPSQKLQLMEERFELMDYYIQTAQQLKVLLVNYDLEMDKKIRDHYYSKYQSVFDGEKQDKGPYLTDEEDLIIQE